MQEIILVLRETEKEALGTVRCFPGLRAAAGDGVVWVRGIVPAVAGDIALRSLPVIQTYELDAGGLLFPQGALTPVMQLPALPWVPLREFIPVTLPVSPLPAKNSDTFPVRLAKSEHETAPFALRTTLALFKQYVDDAADVRLQQMQFAVSANDDVLVTGNPLPALPGTTCWKLHDLLLPAGYHFDPPMLAPLVQARLHNGGQELFLFEASGSYTVIPKNNLVTASRSAVRLSPEIVIGHG